MKRHFEVARTPQRRVRARVITAAALTRRGACADQVAVFRKLWPRGTKVTRLGLVRAARAGLDLVWFARHCLSADAWSVFDEAEAPARRAYNEAVAPARRAYNEAVATALRAFGEAKAPAIRAYNEAVATALWAAWQADARSAVKTWRAVRNPDARVC